MNYPNLKDPITDQPVSKIWFKFFTDTVANINFISPSFVGGQANADLDLSANPISPWPGFLILSFSVNLTAGRTLTLPVAPRNSIIVVSRPATGAFNLSVNGIKNLVAGQWVVLMSDGSVWNEIMFGSL